MWHRVKKIKFRAGKDANSMLVRKLVTNFFAKGKLTSTLKKTKVLKSLVEKLVEKTKTRSEANKKYLLKYLNDVTMLDFLYKNVGTVLKDKTGGYVRVLRLGVRDSDGAEKARLEWAYPIVIEEPARQAKGKVSQKTDSKDKQKGDMKEVSAGKAPEEKVNKK